MANLIDKNDDLLLKFILHPDKDSNDWITYEISICSNNDKEKTLLELSQGGLYLEACFEPEVIAIYNEILNILYGEKTNFSFEPIDEKDFRLNINKINNNLFSVGIYSNYFKIFGIHEWNHKSYIGIKLTVDKNDLSNFIKQLRDEYEKIKPEKQLLTKDSRE